ncbi:MULTISPECIES: hypothetical protein [Burkholderia]|uniref:hypothetical protein n=1 Tax=Burkholderia TaxID=32008 RepID=UPI00084183B2|nr:MULTISPECIES: hypothetical protein [unclassified Burkholderia]AOK29742.1 hypothetical protein AQ611_10215 [Burkholderia sp. Bp7605]
MLDKATVAELPSRDNYRYRTKVAQTSFGEVTTLASPLRYSTVRLPSIDRLVPYGADRPQWRRC